MICGPYQAPPRRSALSDQPVLIIEVLSPSTRDHDLSANFKHYRYLPSVQHLLYVEPDRHHVIHQRTPEGWLRRDFVQGEVVLGDLATLTLAAIYTDLDQVTGP